MCWVLFFGKLQQIPIPREQKEHSKALCSFPDESLSRLMLKLWRYPWTTNTRRALWRKLKMSVLGSGRDTDGSEGRSEGRTKPSTPTKNINRGNDILFLWFFHLSRWSTEISSAVKRDADDIDKQTSRTEPILRCTSRSCRQFKRVGIPRASSHLITMPIRNSFERG